MYVECGCVKNVRRSEQSTDLQGSYVHMLNNEILSMWVVRYHRILVFIYQICGGKAAVLRVIEKRLWEDQIDG